MRAPKLNQLGFGAVGILLAIVFVAVVGFASYKVMTMNKNSKNAVDAVAAEQVVPPATIKTKADLETTGKALDQDGTELDSNLDDSGLNSYVNTML